MKIGIIGASGPTGIQVVKQGLEIGHSIKVLVRSKNSLEKCFDSDEISRIEHVVGDALDKSSISQLVQGVDILVVSLGSRPENVDICSKAQEVINDVISKEAGKSVKRMIVVTSLGVGDSYGDLNWFTWILVNTLIRNAIQDKNIQEKHVRNGSPVDWVIVRPGGLTNGAKTKQYQVAERGIAGGMISRANVAHFILEKCLEGEEYSKKAFAIVQ